MSNETGPPAPLVDEAALQHYLDERLPGTGEVRVQRHQAGHSNETFFITRGDDEWVLRRPPRGAFLPSAHDVGREYRVLTGLKETPARVPRTLLMCEDESIIGAPFYLMERMHGVVIRTEPPVYAADAPPQTPPGTHTQPATQTPGRPRDEAVVLANRRAIGDELVDALIELHSIDPQACGLGDFGKLTGYLERQLRRWTGQLDLTMPFTREIPDLMAVGEWLRSNVPESPATTLVHGDYKLDNVMFSASEPRLIAILDWEMSTLGDPLADLGWMISFWREPEDAVDELFADAGAVTALAGFRSRGELIERYASATGWRVDGLDWYVVLAIWKLAILLEGSYARHLAGMTDDPFFARMEQGVPALAARALEVAHR